MRRAITVRTTADRVRYALLFELLLMVFLAFAGAIVLQRHFLDVGLLTLLLSLKAMIFNFAYNWIYDRAEVRAGKVPTDRSMLGRLVHAFGFELGLVITSLPLIMWWLGFTFLQALLFDLAAASFVVVYTMAFGWSYDRLFPIAQSHTALSA